MSEGEPQVSVKEVNWRYAGTPEQVLKNISISLEKGEILLLTGPNGAGKTTFCNLLNGLIPHFYSGKLEGEVTVAGIDTQKSYVGRLSRHVGLLFQDPASQLISGSVAEEVAFGPENIALPREKIEERIDYALGFVGLDHARDRPPFALSGGQQQALALASILSMSPDIYVLDEPTSNLDPYGTEQVFELIHKIADEENKTFVLVEHELEALIDIADRVMVLNEGEIVAMGPPREILGGKAEMLQDIGLWPPQMSLLAYRLRDKGLIGDEFGDIPMTLEEGVEYFSNILSKAGVLERSGGAPVDEVKDRESVPREGEALIRIEDVQFWYDTGTHALKGVNLEIHENEFTAILGQNGSGKTTLVKHFNGLLEPGEGAVYVRGIDTQEIPTYELVTDVGYVFQNPDQQLFSSKVSDELEFGLKNIGMKKDERKKRVQEVARRMDIEDLLEERPYSLSKGDRQRVVITSILALDPDVIIVDEPTTGQDPRRRREIMDLMKELHKEGKTIVVITHDMSLAAEYAERCVIMHDGKILLDGTPEEVFIQTDQLATTHLTPPAMTQLFIRLSEKFEVPPDILTIDRAVNLMEELLKEGGQQ
jgi:energy-coupling factor transport system ATP-binding protein